MIKHRPKTAKGFLRYHKILWNAIIAELKRLKLSGKDISDMIKYEVYYTKFSFSVSHRCFPCQWKMDNKIFYDGNCRHECLLQNNSNTRCLDGKWHNFLVSCEDNNYDEAIKVAIQIRDTPIRKKLLGGKNDTKKL